MATTSGSAMIRRLTLSPSILFRAIAGKANCEWCLKVSELLILLLNHHFSVFFQNNPLSVQIYQNVICWVLSCKTVTNCHLFVFIGLASYPIVRHQSTDGAKVETRRKSLTLLPSRFSSNNSRNYIGTNLPSWSKSNNVFWLNIPL